MIDIWLRIGGRSAISLRAWLLLAPVSIFGTYGFVPEGLLPGSSVWMGLIVGLIGHVVTGLMLVPAYLTYLSPKVNRRPRPLAAIATLFFAGIVRGFSVAFSLEFFGLVQAASYPQRMMAGAILVVIWFSVAAVLVGARKDYQEVFKQLSDSIERERQLAAKGSDAVARTRQDLVDQVKKTLSEAFASRASTVELHHLADSVIRPLSHSLATRQSLDIEIQTPKRRIQLLPVIQTALTRFPFNPAPVAAIGLLSTLYSRVWNIGLVGFLETLIQAAVIFGLFGLARRAGIRGWIVPLVWIIVGFSANLISWVVLQYDLSQAIGVALWLSVALVLPAGFVSLLLAYDYEREQNIQKLEKALENVMWLERKLNQQLWIEKKRLARYVHSDIQGRVRAAALSNNVLTMADVSKLQAECVAAIDLSRELPSFDRFFSDTAELWGGLVQIKLEAQTSALNAIANDTFGLASVVEIVREGIGNAVRHGKASSIQVDMRLLEQDNPMLELVITNDGEEIKAHADKGFGAQTITEVSSTWGIESSEGKTTLWARVPVALN